MARPMVDAGEGEGASTAAAAPGVSLAPAPAQLARNSNSASDVSKPGRSFEVEVDDEHTDAAPMPMQPMASGSVDIKCAASEPPSPASNSTSGSSASGLRGFLLFMGTGFMAAVAFLDPGNLEADISVGVNSQYSLLWWYCVCTLAFGFAFQVLAGKLGLVTGYDLAHQVGRVYPRNGRLLLWFLLELSILAADIQETVGCALAVQVLSNGAIPLWASCIIISVAAFLLLQVDRFGFRNLEVVYALLILLEGVALATAAFSVKADPVEVVKGFIPKLNTETVVVAAGALGALVMPYNTFFMSNVVNCRPRDNTSEAKKASLVKFLKIETFAMLFLAFVINVFAVVMFAQFANHEEFAEAGLESAGQMIADAFGKTMQTLWGVGLLASGLVATICLTYAGQVIMVGLLQIKVDATRRLVFTRFISLLPCLVLAVVFEATNTFDKVAQIINVIQSLILPFGLIPLIHVTSSEDIMGVKWVNHNSITVIVSTIVVAVVGVNVYTLASLAMNDVPQTAGVAFAFAIVILIYLSLIAYFVFDPKSWSGMLQRARSNGHTLFVWLKTNRRWADIESMLEVHF